MALRDAIAFLLSIHQAKMKGCPTTITGLAGVSIIAFSA